MRAWPVARSIFDAPLVREANERTTGWISLTSHCDYANTQTSQHPNPAEFFSWVKQAADCLELEVFATKNKSKTKNYLQLRVIENIEKLQVQYL